MKKKHISTIIVVAIFSAVFSLILSGMLFSAPEDRSQRVEVVEPITTDFERPASEYFNETSVNPAQKIQIGQDPNSNPFEGSR